MTNTNHNRHHFFFFFVCRTDPSFARVVELFGLLYGRRVVPSGAKSTMGGRPKKLLWLCVQLVLLGAAGPLGDEAIWKENCPVRWGTKRERKESGLMKMSSMRWWTLRGVKVSLFAEWVNWGASFSFMTIDMMLQRTYLSRNCLISFERRMMEIRVIVGNVCFSFWSLNYSNYD